jgi:hypothetical protein
MALGHPLSTVERIALRELCRRVGYRALGGRLTVSPETLRNAINGGRLAPKTRTLLAGLVDAVAAEQL